MTWKNWKAEEWFRFRFVTVPETMNCDICKAEFAEGDLAVTVLEIEWQEYAHASCVERARKCECCKGSGTHPERKEWEGSVEEKTLRPPSCTDCQGRGYLL